MIRTLCKEYTDLAEKDIQKLEEVTCNLKVIADLMAADIFVDCRTKDPNLAIVVAQAAPSNEVSLYEGSVVGEFAYRSKEPAVLRTMELGMPTSDMMAVTQENRSVRQSVSPVKNEAGKVIGVLIAEKDVTAHVKAEKNLSVLARTTEDLMDALMHPKKQREESIPFHVNDGVVMFTPDGVCTYANPVAHDIYRKIGYMDDLEGISFLNLTLDDVSFQGLMDENQRKLHEVQVGHMTLHIKYAMMKNRNLKLTGVVMLISDVTDMREKENELILKSVAISEIHHRVKNNLQTIASLLRLQSRRIDNEFVKTAFSESISRVLSIAATHEILAEDCVDDVDIKIMLDRIKCSIVDHRIHKNITIEILGDNFMINSDRATSIGLVVNEVIQNSLKYAFEEREKGLIQIEIFKGETWANVSITDDGTGYDVSNDRLGSLGTKIIHRIVKGKLKGTLTTESGDAGTRVLFDFPLAQVKF
ncbi:MAG: histidine kinase [Desulfobacterales bacterium]|nr:histidine kinase [Desulfobacterales bacterium]